MKNFWTWKKIALFLGIIGIGIIGLVIADQHDFLRGRVDPETGIGNGVPDPLVGENIPKIIQDKPVNPAKASVPDAGTIDGVRCVKKPC